MSDLEYQATVVETWDDLTELEELTDRDREAVADLADDAVCTRPFAVIHVPEWLREEEGIRPRPGSDTVIYRQITATTAKGVGVKTGTDGPVGWLPKSQITILHVADGIDSPTQTLDAFGAGDHGE